MKKYIFSFVAEVRGEKVMRDIVESVSVCEDLMAIKERHAMALEIEFGRAFRCMEIREMCDG